MAGTLATTTGATSFHSLNNHNHRSSPPTSTQSTSSLHIRNLTTPKASLHAVIDEPLVQSQTIKSISLYDVLNVNRTATASEIKSAYRRLAKRYHPDASGSSTDDDDDRDFIDIHNAYVTLSDPTSRALYDLKLSAGFDRRLYAGAGKSGGFYGGRRWETDQCW